LLIVVIFQTLQSGMWIGAFGAKLIRKALYCLWILVKETGALVRGLPFTKCLSARDEPYLPT
jgi:hypothetical protein